MIHPVRQRAELVAEIQATVIPPRNGVALWWLGQSGYLVKSAATTLLIDAYLSEHLTAKYANSSRPHVRMTAAPLTAPDLIPLDIDLVLASHKHSDHLDPGTIPALLAESPKTKLALPAAIIEYASGLGLPIDRLIGLNAGDTVTQGDASIRAIPSAHESFDVDERGHYPYLGFDVNMNSIRFYHSGDTLAYDGLDRWFPPGRFDILFLPINGRDPARGVAGNMTAAEAITLASRIEPRFVVPHHYDMFTFNTVPISEFVDEAKRLPRGVLARVLLCGERWEVRSWE